jgi:hypothetical protein
MPDLKIDFTWFQDVKGYRLIPAKPLKLRPGQSILDAPARDIQPARIVRNGGALQTYRPFDMPRELFKDFINAAALDPMVKSEEDKALAPMTRSQDGLLKFVERFGPLTYEGLKGRGDNVPDLIDAAEAMLQVRSGRIFGRFLGKLDTMITSDRSGLRLKISPPDLLSALWLQVVWAKDKGRPIECEQCGRPVLGRRADARFCSDACRIQFNSLKRTRRS